MTIDLHALWMGLAVVTVGIVLAWSVFRELRTHAIIRDYQDSMQRGIGTMSSVTAAVDQVADKLQDIHQWGKEQRGEVMTLLLDMKREADENMREMRQALTRNQTFNIQGTSQNSIGDHNAQENRS